MSAGRTRRRAAVVATSTALVAGVVGLVPLLTSPAAAEACPTWTDPAGDSGITLAPVPTDPTGLSAEDDLDMTSVAVAFDGAGGMKATVKVVAMTDYGPEFGAGDEFVVQFAAGATTVKATMKRDAFFTGAETATLAGAASATGKAVFDVATSTITGTFDAAAVKTAFGAPAAGAKLTAFTALSYGYTQTPLGPSVGLPLYDQAPAAASVSYTDAGGCGAAGGGGGSTSTATATATATSSATPHLPRRPPQPRRPRPPRPPPPRPRRRARGPVACSPCRARAASSSRTRPATPTRPAPARTTRPRWTSPGSSSSPRRGSCSSGWPWPTRAPRSSRSRRPAVRRPDLHDVDDRQRQGRRPDRLR